MANYALTITSKVIQDFGPSHTGEDHQALVPTPLLSPVKGKVVRVGTGTMDGSHNIGWNYGKWIVLQDVAGYYHFFAHLSVNTFLAVGAAVAVNQQFATSGATGQVSGPHIHWSVYRILWQRDTLTDPTNYIVKRIAEELAVDKPTPTQRQVLASSPVKRRSAANTAAPISGDPIAASAIVTLNGWITGEAVSGNSTWFRHPAGDFSWSGGFTDTGTHDLTNLNIQTRTTGTVAANRRAQPTTTSPAIAPAVPANKEIEVVGYATGQAVSGNAIWFKAKADGTWSWSGGFTSQAITGLPDLTAEVVLPEPIKITSFGIDVSSIQKSIDLIKVKAEGVEFVVVKLGGLNVSPMYTSVDYDNLVAAAKAASLKVGHYWVIGAGKTPEEQADYFVSHLRLFNVETDVLALDNEKVDANGTNWSDADVALFFKKVAKLTGIPTSRLWHYASATDYRAGTWTQTEALGVKVWWAAHGTNPTTRVPDAEPVIAGTVKEWWVHQFSSQQTVAGVLVDGNWSKQTADVLFARGIVSAPIPDKPDYTKVYDLVNDSIAASAQAAELAKSAQEKLQAIESTTE